MENILNSYLLTMIEDKEKHDAALHSLLAFDRENGDPLECFELKDAYDFATAEYDSICRVIAQFCLDHRDSIRFDEEAAHGSDQAGKF